MTNKNTYQKKIRSSLTKALVVVFCCIGLIALLPAMLIPTLFVHLMNNQDSEQTGDHYQQPGSLITASAFETHYIPQEHFLSVQTAGGAYRFFYDGEPVEADVIRGDLKTVDIESDGQVRLVQNSLDGSAAYFIIDDTLYISFRGQISALDSGVKRWSMAASGSAMVYYSQDTLWYCDISCGKTRSIVSARDIVDFRVSANGEYVVYSTASSLNVWRRGESVKLADGEFGVLNASDDAEQFYATSDGCLYRFSLSGEKTLLSRKEDAYFTADGSQILYYSDDATYISINGQDPILLCNRILKPILPSGYQLRGQICPFSSFKGTVCCIYGGGATWLIQEDMTAYPTPGSPFNEQLDATGRYLYYFDQEDNFNLKCYDLCTRSSNTLSRESFYEQFILPTQDGQYLYVTTGEQLIRIDAVTGDNSTTVTSALGWNVDDISADDQGNLYYCNTDGFCYFNGSYSICLDGIKWVKSDLNRNLYACTNAGEVVPMISGELVTDR